MNYHNKLYHKKFILVIYGTKPYVRIHLGHLSEIRQC